MPESSAAKSESSGARGPVGEPPRPSSNRAPDTSAAYTDREYALMEALREALSMLPPKQAFAEPTKYDSLYMKTLPLDLREEPSRV